MVALGCSSECTGLFEAGEVASENRFGAGELTAGVLGALRVSGVRHNRMVLFDEELCGHEAETVRGACDEGACHVEPHFLCWMIALSGAIASG